MAKANNCVDFVVTHCLSGKMQEKLQTVLAAKGMDSGIGTKVLSGLSGLYCTPAVGIKAGMYKAQVGFNVQRISESGIGFDMNAIQIKVGVMF